MGVEFTEQKETVKNSGKRVLRYSFPKIYAGNQDLRARRSQKYEGRGQVCFVYCHIPSLDEHVPVRGVSLPCVAKTMGIENEDSHDPFFNEVWLSRNEMMGREAMESDAIFFFVVWGVESISHMFIRVAKK